MNVDITVIIEALITLIVALCTTFFIPWLREKVDSEKLQKTLQYVDIAVAAAEQLAKAQGWDGEDKKDYVIEYLTARGLTVNYDLIDAMIESSVLKLREDLKT